MLTTLSLRAVPITKNGMLQKKNLEKCTNGENGKPTPLHSVELDIIKKGFFGSNGSARIHEKNDNN